jgi:deoxyribonuclease-4
MPHLLIGAHISIAGGFAGMFRAAQALGATCAQVFTSSPQQWRGRVVSDADVADFRAGREATGVWPVVAHAGYLINLASLDDALLEKSRAAFREELGRCGRLGIPLVVVHWGSYKGGTAEDGLDRLAASLDGLIPVADDLGVRIALETTAGGGSALGGDFAHFPPLSARMAHAERLAACLDLAHVYAAGYDLRTPDAWAATWAAFDAAVGIHRLRAIHVNNTAMALGSRRDRHANLRHGELTRETYRLLMHDARLARVPKLLETPTEDDGHLHDLDLLRLLAGARG